MPSSHQVGRARPPDEKEPGPCKPRPAEQCIPAPEFAGRWLSLPVFWILQTLFLFENTGVSAALVVVDRPVQGL